MKIQCKDHFSENSQDYSTYRPEYPPELFAFLASIAPTREKAWDCATGSGQSARSLIRYFSEVIATDASSAQISKAKQSQGITYRVAPAEQSGIASRSMDLITVAQALHWFDIRAFFQEADRVLKPGGILAAWSYNLLQINPAIDKVINHFYGPVLEKYWPTEREMVEQGYAAITFPFQEVAAPAFAMRQEWNLPQLTGYLGTWSAVKRYQKKRGVNPLLTLHADLTHIWGNPENRLPVTWPLTIRIRKRNS